LNPSGLRIKCLYIVWFFFAVLAFISFIKDDCLAGELDTSIDFSYDKSDKIDISGTDTTESAGQKYSLKYKETVNMMLNLEGNFSLGVDESWGTGQFSTKAINPEIGFGISSDEWGIDTGARESISYSDDPLFEKETTLDYFISFSLKPESILVPDVGLDIDKAETAGSGRQDTLSTTLDISKSFDINLLGMNLDLGYNKSVFNDRIVSDSDTKDMSYDIGLKLKQDITNAISYSFNYSFTKGLGYVYLDTGGFKDKTASHSHGYKNSIDYDMFPNTKLAFSYDYTIDLDLVSKEKSVSRTAATNLKQGIYDWIDLKFDYAKDVGETLDSAGDKRTISNKFGTSVKLSPNKFFDISIDASQDKSVDDYYVDIKDATSVNKDLSFAWGTQITEYIKLTYDLSNTRSYTEGKLESDDDAIKLKIDLKGDTEIGLTITPGYSRDKSQDLMISSITSKSESFDLAIDYDMELTDNMNLKLSHSYSKSEDLLTSIIDRSDDSSLDYDFKEPIREVSFSASATRTTSDTSGDEEGPITDMSYSFSFNWAILNMNFDMSYGLDVPQEASKSENFDIGMKMGFLDLGDFDFSYSFSQDLEGELNKSKSITVSYKMSF
jgi:hypothetical protein